MGAEQSSDLYVEISKEILEGAHQNISQAIKNNPNLFKTIKLYFDPLKARKIIYTDLEKFEHGCYRSHEGMTVSVRRHRSIDSVLALRESEFRLRYHFCRDCKSLFILLS
jgi:hypothetical protein